MFKRYLAAFLGSLTAIWVSIIVTGVLFFVFMMVFVVGVGAGSGSSADASILRINLSGVINDRVSVPSVSELMLEDAEKAQSFETIIAAIHEAAKDKKIKGIYLDCSGADMGYALREELIGALQEFKKSGKWIEAYSDSYTQGDYYVACVADNISLNPVGAVDVRGLAAQIPFFKNALDKLGVEMQIVKVGTFKSAVEPFIMNEPSEASVLQTRVYLDSIWNNMSSYMAGARSVSDATVNMWADSIISTAPAKWLSENKVVNKLEYRRQFEDRLCKLVDADEDDGLPAITPDEYMKTRMTGFDPVAGYKKSGKHIAVLYATGDIVDNGEGGIVGSTMVPEIIDLADDDDVAGVVLRVNSGGGSAFASEQIWEALQYLKSKDKPLYVSMADYAASGGYYISCGADRIYADPNTITGSIGIFGMIPNIHNLLSDKIGINVATVQTNANADFGNITNPLTPYQLNALQSSVDQGYDLFTRRVAAGRDIPLSRVLEIAEGRVWDGRTALRIGLVDELGSLQSAIDAMAKKTNLKNTDIATYPRLTLSPFEQLLLEGMTSGSPVADKVKALIPAPVAGLAPAEAAQCYTLLRSLTGSSPVQARMMPVTLR